jgi:hypothetical protein
MTTSFQNKQNAASSPSGLNQGRFRRFLDICVPVAVLTGDRLTADVY